MKSRSDSGRPLNIVQRPALARDWLPRSRLPSDLVQFYEFTGVGIKPRDIDQTAPAFHLQGCAHNALPQPQVRGP
jgi:hypothetical protein